MSNGIFMQIATKLGEVAQLFADLDKAGTGSDSGASAGNSNQSKKPAGPSGPNNANSGPQNPPNPTGQGAKIPDAPPMDVPQKPTKADIKAVFAPFMAAHPSEDVQLRLVQIVKGLCGYFGCEQISELKKQDEKQGAIMWGIALWKKFFEAGGELDPNADNPYENFDSDAAVEAAESLLLNNDPVIEIPPLPETSGQNVENSGGQMGPNANGNGGNGQKTNSFMPTSM